MHVQYLTGFTFTLAFSLAVTLALKSTCHLCLCVLRPVLHLLYLLLFVPVPFQLKHSARSSIVDCPLPTDSPSRSSARLSALTCPFLAWPRPLVAASRRYRRYRSRDCGLSSEPRGMTLGRGLAQQDPFCSVFTCVLLSLKSSFDLTFIRMHRTQPALI